MKRQIDRNWLFSKSNFIILSLSEFREDKKIFLEPISTYSITATQTKLTLSPFSSVVLLYCQSKVRFSSLLNFLCWFFALLRKMIAIKIYPPSKIIFIRFIYSDSADTEPFRKASCHRNGKQPGMNLWPLDCEAIFLPPCPKTMFGEVW